MEENENIDAERTGNFIRELRIAHNLTQEELGDKLFISRKSVSKWETGVAVPKIDMIKRISKVFGVTVDDIIAGKFVSKIEAVVVEEDEVIPEELNVKVKTFKIVGIVCASMIFLVMICYFVSTKSNSLVFRVNYEDDNFFISNGLLVLGENSYLHLGDLESYIGSVDVTDFKFSLYLEEDDNLTRIMDLVSGKTNTLVDDVKAKLESIIIDNEINNLVLKVYYFNSNDEEVSFNLKLNIFRDVKTPILNNRLNTNNIGRERITGTHNDEMNEFYFEIPDMIDVSFLFDMDKNYLKRCIFGKRISSNTDIYEIIYDELGDNITFQHVEKVVHIMLESKRILIFGDGQFYYAVNPDNIIKTGEVYPYYDLIYDIIISLKDLCLVS